MKKSTTSQDWDQSWARFINTLPWDEMRHSRLQESVTVLWLVKLQDQSQSWIVAWVWVSSWIRALIRVVLNTGESLRWSLIECCFSFQNSSPWWRRSEPPASVCVKSRVFKYTFCFMTHNITIVLDLHFSSVCDKLKLLSSFQFQLIN